MHGLKKESYKTFDSSSSSVIQFNKELYSYASTNNNCQLDAFLIKDESICIMKEFTYEVLSKIISVLNKEYSNFNKELYYFSNKILYFLSITCQPSELLLYLIEQIDHVFINYHNLFFFNPLKLCIIRSQNPVIMMHMFIDYLSRFLKYLNNFQTQSTYSVNENLSEQLILYYIQISNFLVELLEAFESQFCKNISSDNFKFLVLPVLINLFGKPICFTNFNGKSCKFILKRLLKIVQNIKYDIIFFFQLINYGNLHKFCLVKRRKFYNSNSCEIVNDLSLSNFYWFIFQPTTDSKIIQIYNPHYIAFSCINISNFLMDTKDSSNVLVVKALDILHYAMNIIKNFSIPFEALDLSLHLELAKNLIKIIKNVCSKKIKKFAFDNFIHFINGFKEYMQYVVIKNILTLELSPDVICIVITILKNSMVISKVNQESNYMQYKNLVLNESVGLLIPKICVLLKKDNDLLEIYDQLTTTLNFILFLIIRDKKKGEMYNYFIITKFLETLKIALDHQKSEWNLNLDNLFLCKSKGSSRQSIWDSKYKCMQYLGTEQKIDLCNIAINRLLIIENTLHRIYDIISK